MALMMLHARVTHRDGDWSTQPTITTANQVAIRSSLHNIDHTVFNPACSDDGIMVIISGSSSV